MPTLPAGDGRSSVMCSMYSRVSAPVVAPKLYGHTTVSGEAADAVTVRLARPTCCTDMYRHCPVAPGLQPRLPTITCRRAATPEGARRVILQRDSTSSGESVFDRLGRMTSPAAKTAAPVRLGRALSSDERRKSLRRIGRETESSRYRRDGRHTAACGQQDWYRNLLGTDDGTAPLRKRKIITRSVSASWWMPAVAVRVMRRIGRDLHSKVI